MTARRRRLAQDPLSLDFGRNKSFCVYLYRDPRYKRRPPIYVGKGVTMRRPEQHWRRGAHNKQLAEVLQSIKAAGLEPIIEFVGFFDTEQDALNLEGALIHKFKLNGTLCNIFAPSVGERMTARITLIIDKSMVNRIDVWRLERFPLVPRNAAMRELIDRGLLALGQDIQVGG